MDIGEIEDDEAEAVAALWKASGLTRPWNDPYADIELARSSPESALLVGREEGAVVGSVMVGHDGHRGWVYYLAVASDRRRSGRGAALMAAAERWLQARRLPKLQLMVRTTNVEVMGFYDAIGFKDQDVVVLGKWIDGRPN
jgi:ribosomal protein S18 acetylase RimI-like enzyme